MIVLASNSPRRKELLSLITEDFIVEPSMADETVGEDVPLLMRPCFLAQKKAESVFKNHTDDIVIGCDTGVFIDNQMLGKPKDEDDARRLLKLLSGRTHRVVTGCCIVSREKSICFSQTTEVEFYQITDSEIDCYIATGEPMDKAGAYGIQGKGGLFVKRFIGDYFNVVGLPVAELNRKLREFGAAF